MKKLLLIFILSFFLSNSLSFAQTKKPFFEPEKGFVPAAATAIKIAEAVWLPIYGDGIYSKKPFMAELRDGIWYVNGTSKDMKGGVPYAEISQRDGCILNVYHDK